MAATRTNPVAILGILFILIGFAFKVSAVPFHTWAPDTYEGTNPCHSVPRCRIKSRGMVALIQLVFVAFPGRDDVVQPFFWVISALTMTIGNLIAFAKTTLSATAYSGVAQGDLC